MGPCSIAMLVDPGVYLLWLLLRVPNPLVAHLQSIGWNDPVLHPFLSSRNGANAGVAPEVCRW